MSKKNQQGEKMERVLEALLHRILYRVELPKKDVRGMRADFLRLFSFYQAEGLSPKAIRLRVGEDILGDFYRSPRPDDWYPLDSAAKVYPLSLTHTRMTMFRVSAYLKNPVQPAVLQVALLSCIKRFPMFAVSLRRGVFWHYLDGIRRRFCVEEESEAPCTYMSMRTKNAPCFKVRYYKNRISAEFFHALTDGSGAMVFLKTLLSEYLRLLGIEVEKDESILDVSASPLAEEAENAFLNTAKDAKACGFMQHQALQIGQKKRKCRTARIMQFQMPADKLLEAAHNQDATVTAFLSAAILRAARESIPYAAAGDRLQVQVPVNMRQVYPTKSLRNFSLYAVLSVEYQEENPLPLVKEQLAASTEKAYLDGMLHSTRNMTENPVVRYMPLGLKGAALRKIYGFLGEKVLTSTLSNIGVVKNEFGGKVERFDAMIGSAYPTNTKCALISYQNCAILSISSRIRDNMFEERLYHILRKAGIPIEVEGTV